MNPLDITAVTACKGCLHTTYWLYLGSMTLRTASNRYPSHLEQRLRSMPHHTIKHNGSANGLNRDVVDTVA